MLLRLLGVLKIYKKVLLHAVFISTMRTISSSLVAFFLFLLPWKLNGNLTSTANVKRNTGYTTEKLQELTPEGSSGLLSATGAGKENVVSLSKSTQMQNLTETSISEQQDIRVMTSSADMLNERRKRYTDDKENNLKATPAQMAQEEVTTPEKELIKQSLNSFLNTTESFNNTKTTKGLIMDITPKQPQNIPSTSTSTGLQDTQSSGTDVNNHKTSTISDLYTTQPSLDTTVQQDTMIYTHTSTAKSVTYFSVTENMKTTHKEEIPERTDGAEIQSTFTITPQEIFTTLKTTTKKVVPLPNNNPKSPGSAVAAVIGSTFVLMFIVILVILLRKRKIQKRQLENAEWAGPSPFLDGDVQPDQASTLENEPVNRRGFSQVSISKYLPQRLSKHLSLRRDTNEEVFMGDILQASTFGRQNPEEIQAPNGEPTVVQDSPKTKEDKNHQGPASMDSADSKTPKVTVDMNESGNDLNDDVSTNSSQDPVVKPLMPLVSIDLESLSEETALSQTSDVGNVPPAPPLP